MKFKHYLIIFIASFGISFFMASCLNKDNQIPPNCFDGILNNDEEGIDCGGSCEKACNHCINGIFEPNKGETWVDCGGPCPVCDQCANGIKDGSETGIDCGGDCGSCQELCDDGLLNGLENEIDCQYNIEGIEIVCNLCPTCVDGIMNGLETGIDCGPGCEPCCASNNCRNGSRDGEEFWNDCGGRTCPDCPDTLSFRVVSSNVNAFVPSQSISFSEIGSPVIEATSIGTATNDAMITIRFTEFTTPNKVYNLASISPEVAAIIYVDEFNVVYSSEFMTTPIPPALPTSTAMGTVTFVRKAEAIVPNDNLDGCHKPAGTYRYWRATFSNVILQNATGTMSVNLSDGVFQHTIKPQ